jgi:AcrR family transcriptional regulator
MSSTAPSPDDAVIAAFWRVAALSGWHGVTMRAIAIEAGLEPAELRRRFAGPQMILEAHGRAVDAAVVAGTVDDPTSTARDRLFDVLMRRLDELAPHREGVLRLWRELPRTPLLGFWLAGQLPISMAWMLEAAALPASGVKGALRVQGLGLVWLATLRAWEDDESPDLPATMAALDRALDQADRAARWLSLGDDAVGVDAAMAEPDASMDAGVTTATVPVEDSPAMAPDAAAPPPAMAKPSIIAEEDVAPKVPPIDPAI